MKKEKKISKSQLKDLKLDRVNKDLNGVMYNMAFQNQRIDDMNNSLKKIAITLSVSAVVSVVALLLGVLALCQ